MDARVLAPPMVREPTPVEVGLRSFEVDGRLRGGLLGLCRYSRRDRHARSERVWLGVCGCGYRTRTLKLSVQGTGRSTRQKGSPLTRFVLVDCRSWHAVVASAESESHTPSPEDLDVEDAHQTDDFYHFVRLDGEPRVLMRFRCHTITCASTTGKHSRTREQYYYINLVMQYTISAHLAERGPCGIALRVWVVRRRWKSGIPLAGLGSGA
ncbi:hypothetical protein DFH06DRAFT_341797 [Mycena polygramma]|nr:hypothetical protein DFH06DRAFT_341797 [Mycena polygramma]